MQCFHVQKEILLLRLAHDAEHFGAALNARPLHGAATALHFYFLGAFHFALGAALNTIRCSCGHLLY